MMAPQAQRQEGTFMKKMLLLSASLLACGLTLAQDVGHVISASPILQQVTVPRQVCNNDQGCTTQNFYENRPVAYTVVYELGGKQYTVQMPSDPGPTVQLQIAPVNSQMASVAPLTYAQPLYEQPTYLVTTAPPLYYDYGPSYGYTTYSAAPNYLPLAVFLGMGWAISNSHHGHYRGHWR
jgi:hypothetical protein